MACILLNQNRKKGKKPYDVSDIMPDPYPKQTKRVMTGQEMLDYIKKIHPMLGGKYA